MRIDIFGICARTLEVLLNLSFNENNSKSRAKVCVQWRMSLRPLVFVCLLLIYKRCTTHFGEVFYENDTTDSEECDQK